MNSQREATYWISHAPPPYVRVLLFIISQVDAGCKYPTPCNARDFPPINLQRIVRPARLLFPFFPDVFLYNRHGGNLDQNQCQ